jgi:hypothetical protein
MGFSFALCREQAKKKRNSFSVFSSGSLLVCCRCSFLVLAGTRSQNRNHRRCPQKGAFTGADTGAGNSSRPNFTDMALIYHYPIDQEQT